MSRPDALLPRKSPRQRRARLTVASLLEAAAQLIETQGMDGFNTNAVAERAGVSIGSLYQYFPSKDALTLALLEREAGRFEADALAALEAPDGPAALRHLIGASVRQQLERPELARLLDEQEGRPELRAHLDKGRFGQLIDTLLQRPGLPRQMDAALAAADVAALIRGLVDGAGERRETDLADLQRRVEAAVFGYLERAAAAAPGGQGRECESGMRAGPGPA
ncbi:helix-turn-helix domain-containing protein [Pelomonas sp. APW6]|uniref:Helix-turn-helix domain-containing protein n=1 Tax=Roseateles subflavus TaxID=3053353 RepID=A0ABT7LEI8_9BURK|nr:TetR/AcrR family transcriptional regulator [Pelomonas sp. APW6]MDL5031276.1 helix-turn-helix domain-containing protein [Pelomonas sp. APW6]